MNLARIAAALTMSAVLVAALPAPTAGDGLPAEVRAAPAFVPGGGLEYTTISVGRATVVRAGKRGGGMLIRSARLRRHYVIPAVAYDGSPGGLSARRPHAGIDQPAPPLPSRNHELRDPGPSGYGCAGYSGFAATSASTPCPSTARCST